MPLNTTYSLEPDAAIKGMVADSRRGFNTITAIAGANLLPGKLVTRSAGKVVIPSAVDDFIVGSTIWTTTLVQPETGNAVWSANKSVPVSQADPIWLEAQEAIAQDALVYAVISGAGNIAGDVKSTQGADTTTKPVGRAETVTTAAGQLVRVKLLPALQGA